MNAGMSDVESALVQSLKVTDGSRRVGWARAYSAEQTKEDLSAALNLARHDATRWQKAASFLYGMLSAYAQIRDDGAHLRSQLGRWKRGFELFLDDDFVRAGVKETLNNPRLNDSRIERIKARDVSKMAVRSHMLKKVSESLAAQYGFFDQEGKPDLEAMHAYLSGHLS